MSDPDPIRVVFFGDSICVGQGVSLYKGWVTRIAQELDELGEKHGRDIIVVNSSINGRTTRQALEDMPYHVQSAGVDVLIVQFGMNDCNYWATDNGLPRVSQQAFQANLREIIARGRKFGAKAIVLNNSHPTSRTTEVFPKTGITYQQSNKSYSNLVREVAISEGEEVLFNDVDAHFTQLMQSGLDINDCLLADRLHLSEKGHQVYHQFLSEIIGQTVSRILE